MHDQILGYSRSFSYRQNMNGSIDSICLVCSRTVGRGLELAELRMMENGHNCERAVLPNCQLDFLANAVTDLGATVSDGHLADVRELERMFALRSNEESSRLA